MKTVKAKVRLSRISSNMREDYAMIELVDRNSGDMIANIEMELADLGALISGLTINTPVKVFPTHERLGLKREAKRELIPYKWVVGYDDNFEAEMKKKAKKFEVDGWELQPEKFNHHRWNNGKYSCLFIRYVEGDKEEEDEY